MDKAFYLKRWPPIREGLLAIIDAFEHEDLGYVPVEGGWAVGRIILHISSAANYWLHSGILSPINIYRPGVNDLAHYPTLAAIKVFLAEEHARTLKLLQSFNQDAWDQRFTYPDGYAYPASWVFWHVLEHEIHHRGELSLIQGILGREGLDV
jgi:uncharacterized damage-inducible protein DinB